MILAFGLAAPAAADEWHTVMRDRDRQVEIDRATIIQSDSGTKVAWGRIVLRPDEAQREGYATIKALNRYDCLNRSFYTVKRVYLDARQMVLREEAAADQSPVEIGRSGVDERMWREVCKPASAAELQEVAAEAGRAASEAEPIPIPGARSVGGRRAATAAKTEDETPGQVPVRSADFRAVASPSSRPTVPGEAATPAAAPMMPRPAAPPPAPPRAAREPAAPIAALAPAARPSRGASAGKAADDAAKAVAHRDIHWSYEGETGPEHWARLRPDWKLCGEGKRQSPIDLRDGVAVNLDPVRVDYRDTRFRITDNGHTIQVDVGEGLAMAVRGRRYELVQFHFHRPAEERIDGRAFDMVAHFLHRDVDGRLAVLAVLLERGEQPNALMQTLWNNLPLERGSGYMPATAINPAGLLPPTPEHYLYMGSLTTPPCTEDVLWVVMKQPVQVSDEQLRIFARLYPRNSRPPQEANGRLILESR